MTIYYIAVTSWDGRFDYIRPFLTKQKRDEALAKMAESPAYKRGDIDLYVEEEELEDFPDEAVEGKVYMSFAPGHNQMVMADVDLPTNTKVRIIIVKEDEK